MSSELPSPPSAPRATELRARILSAAARLFAERGYAGTSMREVAEAASCTKPALYYYFKSKEGLFLEVIREETRAGVSIVEASLHAEGSVRERIAVGVRAYFDRIRQNPVGLGVMLRAEIHRDDGQPEFDFRALRAHHVGMVRELLAAGLATGEIREDVELDAAVLGLLGMVDLRCRLYVCDQMPLSDASIDQMLSLFFDGVGPRGSSQVVATKNIDVRKPAKVLP